MLKIAFEKNSNESKNKFVPTSQLGPPHPTSQEQVKGLLLSTQKPFLHPGDVTQSEQVGPVNPGWHMHWLGPWQKPFSHPSSHTAENKQKLFASKLSAKFPRLSFFTTHVFFYHPTVLNMVNSSKRFQNLDFLQTIVIMGLSHYNPPPPPRLEVR